MLYLYVTFDKADVGQRYQSVRFIKLYVTNNALPIDRVSNRCRAEYVSNDNVWRKVAADPDNIYYDAGKVGVGGEPTINPLHQQPAFPIMFHVHGRSWLQNGLRVEQLVRLLPLTIGTCWSPSFPCSWEFSYRWALKGWIFNGW